MYLCQGYSFGFTCQGNRTVRGKYHQVAWSTLETRTYYKLEIPWKSSLVKGIQKISNPGGGRDLEKSP